ncbi:MAG TPA: acyltransferase [Herpetosiphonaceae bacterium]
MSDPSAPSAVVSQAVPAHARVAVLDVLRGVAALAVVVVHALPLLAPSATLAIVPVFDFGSFGVLLFFLCSGTIIPATLERHQSLRRFWIRRVCRLYPLYWLSIGGALLGYAAGRTSLAGMELHAARFAAQPVATVLANITMMQEFLGYPHLIYVYWTLTFELAFYFLISALFRLKLMGKILPFSFGLLLVAFLVHLLAVLQILRLPNTNALRNIDYLALMFVAVALYHVRRRERSRRAVVALGGLALALIVLTAWQDPAIGTAWLVAAVLFGLAQRSTIRWFPRWLLYLGAISYSIYLLHPLVFALVPRIGGPLTTGLCWLSALLVCAALAERWVERPGIALGYYLTRNTRGTSRQDMPAPIVPLPGDVR